MNHSRLNPVRILGGGFSGLTVAYYLAKHGIAVEVYEKSHRCGGVLGTENLSWGLVESAANGLLGNNQVYELFQDLQIEPAEKSRESSARYIFRNGRPQKWPLTIRETLQFIWGFCKILFSRLHSEPLSKGESLESWVSRHFGQSVFDNLIGAALRGIYGSHDLNASLIVSPLLGSKNKPKEKNSREEFKKKPTKNRQMRGTVAPQNGMQELVSALEKKITEWGGRIFLNTEGEVQAGMINVVATPAPVASLLLAGHDPAAARVLGSIAYLPITTATLGFAREANRLPGFGCLFAAKENMNSLGVLFNNSIFKNRSPEHTETWMFNQVDDNDGELLHKISRDRQRLLNASDEVKHAKITRWPHALPHYSNGLAKALDELNRQELEAKHIFLTGNYLGRIGLAKILDYNDKLAQKILRIL